MTESSTNPPVIRIDTVDFDRTEIRELQALFNSFEGVSEIRHRATLQESAEPFESIIKQLILVFGAKAAGTIGKKTLDEVSEIVKNYFKKRGESNVKSIIIYDHNGEPLVKVKRHKIPER
jgi:hypothetical protein